MNPFDNDAFRNAEAAPPRQPIFNIPRSVAGLSIILLAIHELRQWLPEALNVDILLRFAFIPLRFSHPGQAPEVFGDNDAWGWVTPVTYAFLHGDWQHVGVNTLWLVAFGSAVARRFGDSRFLLFSLLCAVGGAGVHYLFHSADATPVIGASAAISGQTAAAARFIFEFGGPLGALRLQDDEAFRRPAMPFFQSLKNPRVFAFVGIWFALTLFTGVGVVPIGLEEGASVAWEAHLGGFIAGLLLFPIFDPIRRARAPAERWPD